MQIEQLLNITFTLFAVIDIIGMVPLYLQISQKHKTSPLRTSLYAGLIMIVFLFTGTYIFKAFGIMPSHFALAGSLLILFFGIKMMFGIHSESQNVSKPTPFFPMAFPLIAGPGTLSTLLTFKAQTSISYILVAILINIIICYVVLVSSNWLSDKIGERGLQLIERVFGVFLVAMGIKILLVNLFISVEGLKL
jgi:multiple antibiotic resistance protein